MPRPPRASLALAASLVAAAAAAQHDGVVTAADRPAVDYLRDVRPILAKHCYRCHGPDAKERKAELRLDLRADAFADRDGVPAFVAGAPDRSEAFLRITSDDPDEVSHRWPSSDRSRGAHRRAGRAERTAAGAHCGARGEAEEARAVTSTATGSPAPP